MSCWSSQTPADGEMQGGRRTESAGYMPYYGAPVRPPYPYYGGQWNSAFPVGGVPPWTQMGYPPPLFGFPPPSYYPYAPYPNHRMTPLQQPNMGMRQEEMQNVPSERDAPPLLHDQMTARMTATQMSSSRAKTETKSAHRSEEQTQSDEHGNTAHDASMKSPEDSDMPYCRICDFVPKGVAKELKLKAHHYRHLETDFKIFRFVCSCGLRTNSLEAADNHTEEEPDEHKMDDRRDAMEQHRQLLIIGKSKEEYQKELTNSTNRAKWETTSTITSKQQTLVKCELCFCEFQLATHMRDHQYRLHMAELRQIYRYICSVSDCALKSGDHRQRQRHQSTTGHQVEDMVAMALEQLTKAIANGPTPNDLQLKQPTNVNAKCLMCDKTFSVGGNLRKHELAVHMGCERKMCRFVCKGCTFATGATTTRHRHQLRTNHEIEDRRALVLAKLQEVKSNWGVSRGADNVDHAHSATHEHRDKRHKTHQNIATKRVQNPFRVLKATKKKRPSAIIGAVQSESSDDDEMEESGSEDNQSNAITDVGGKRRV